MTEREALKMAIEFLEDNQHHVADNERHAYVMEYNNVIEMCKIALAQPEQEPVAWRWGVQKLKNGDFEWRYSLNQTRPDAIPLYTTPPQPEPVIDKSAAVRIATALGWEPKRKPLTDEQILELNFDGEFCVITDDDEQILDFARAIEAAHGIKEKNT